MVQMNARIAFIFSVFITACAAPVAKPAPVGVVPDAGGLQPAGTHLRIDFWRDGAGVLTAVNRLKGSEPTQKFTVPGCGDVVVWPDGLRLIFVEGDFRGWVMGDRREGVICG